MDLDRWRREKRALQAIVALLALVPLAAGLSGVISGPAFLHAMQPWPADLDSHLRYLSGVLLAPFTDYVRKDLGYVSDRPYIPLNLPINMSWDRSAKLGGPDDLAIALAVPSVRIVAPIPGKARSASSCPTSTARWWRSARSSTTP